MAYLDDNINKIIAELRFGILGAKEDLKTVTSELTTQQARVQKILQEGQAKQQAILQESQTKTDVLWNDLLRKQELAQDAHNVRMLQSEEKHQAQLSEIASRNGLNDAKQQAIQAQGVAVVAKTEAQKTTTVAVGEAKVSKIVADEELVRQRIVKESNLSQLAAIKQRVEQEKLLYMQSRAAAFDSTGSMGDLLWRHTSWLLTGAAIFETLALMKEGVADVEKGMKGLQTVLPILHENQMEYNEAQKEAIDLMQQYGASLDEVMSAGRSFGRMYKDVDTVMGLVNNSILMNVVDNVNLEEAVRGNEAALAVYGDGLKSFNEIMAFSNHTMDAWTRLSHETLASATDLINITERAAGSAKVAKTSFDELMGLGSAAVRSTGLPGANIGNMLKTVMAQLAAPTDKVEEQIEAIGVKMRDANGELRSAYDILLDLSLATKDATVSQEELANAEKAAASGKFQYSKVAALMGQFDEIAKNTARAINNQGMTLQMAGQQIDTIERKAKMLRATLVDTFSGAGDSGLRETLKGLIDVINQFIMGLNKVSSVLINGSLMVGAALLGYKALSAAFGALIPVVATLTGMEASFAAITGAVAAGEMEAAVGAWAMEGAMAGLSATTAIATAGLSVLVGGLVYFIYKAGAAEKKQQEFTQSVKENTAIHQQQLNQYKETTDFLGSMSDKYNQLSGKLKTLKKGTEEYKSTNESLQAVKEAILLATGDEIKKELKLSDAKGAESKVTRALIDDIIDLEKEHTKATKIMLENDVKQTKQVIKNVENRITALTTEMGFWAGLQSYWGKTGHGTLANIAGAFAGNKGDAAEKAKSDLLKAKNDLSTLSLEVAQMKSGDLADDAGGAGGGSGSKADALSDALKALGENANAFSTAGNTAELTLSRLARAISLNDTQTEILSDKFAAGTATLADYARMQELIQQKVVLVAAQQKALTSENKAYQSELTRLNPLLAKATSEYNRFKKAGDKEHMAESADAIQEIQGRMEELSDTINENSQTIITNRELLKSLKTDGYDKVAEGMEAWMNHMEALGEMSSKEQLDFLMTLDLTKMSLGEQWKIEEQIFQARSKYYDELKEKAINAIEAEAEAAKKASQSKIDALQNELDALDEQNTELERQKSLEEALQAVTDAQKGLTDAQAKLANVQGERNTRIWQNGRWEYSANPDAVREAQSGVDDAKKNLANAESSYSDKVLDIQRERLKESLQAQIEHEKKIQQTEQDSYEKQKKDTQEFYKAFKEGRADFWKGFNETETIQLQAYEKQVRDMIQRLSIQWQNYQALMEESGVSVPTTGAVSVSVPSTSGISSSSSSSTTNNSVNRSVNIDTVNVQGVSDVSGLVRNVTQLAG